MNGKQARLILGSYRERYLDPIAFYKAAGFVGMSKSDFGRLLHAKDTETLKDLNCKKEEVKQLEMF